MESTAQSLKAVFSPLNFQGDKTPDFLEPGIYVFGRAMLKFTDMRVSRDQVQLNVLEDKVTAVRVRFFDRPTFVVSLLLETILLLSDILIFP